MPNPEAARLAEALRAAMKSQNLSGADLADRVERLTGERPHPMRVSRWTTFSESRALIRISPDLAVVAAALNLDPVELICDAVRQAAEGDRSAGGLGRVMHYWPQGGGFICSTSDGLRSSSIESVTCPDCLAVLDVEVPARPGPDEYADLPVLDIKQIEG